MTDEARQMTRELQDVLTAHGAALFFSSDNEGELWIRGECHGHITHSDDGQCRLIEGSPCASGDGE